MDVRALKIRQSTVKFILQKIVAAKNIGYLGGARKVSVQEETQEKCLKSRDTGRKKKHQPLNICDTEKEAGQDGLKFSSCFVLFPCSYLELKHDIMLHEIIQDHDYFQTRSKPALTLEELQYNIEI